MKKQALHPFWCLFVQVLLLTTASTPIHAQASDPSTWDIFINSDKNVIVSDTFRLQTFRNRQLDNWNFELSDGAAMLTESSVLKLPLGSSISFESYLLSGYENVSIVLRLARRSMAAGEKLSLEWIRNGLPGKADDVYVKNQPSSQNFFVQTISGNPTSVRILVSQPNQMNNSGYCLADSVYAFGNIPKYSLFTGAGNWDDTTHWSHLPPLRNRNALLNGAVTTQSDIQCSNTALYEGQLQIGSGTTFETNNLHLYNTGSLLTSAGALNIRKQIFLHKTFGEKGRWYFISFPFNVYPENIDNRFQQKDATPNDGGNYFYVQTYNGEKRALNNQSSGNWEVVPIRTGKTPLFEKNKGYLIALDASAEDTTLTFASEPGEIPEEFAQSGTVVIPVSAERTEINAENHGWYLCGNPFPSELPISRLKNNSALDGYIYLYDGNSYKAYPINGSYKLPPYSAFFVKASGNTEIHTTSPENTSDEILLQTSLPVSLQHTEPSIHSSQPTATEATPPVLHCFFRGNMLYLENVTEEGILTLFDLSGRCLFKQSIQQNTRHLSMSITGGFYIIHIQTASMQYRKKICIL